MKGICFKPHLHKLTVTGVKTQTRRIISKENYINKNGVILSTTHDNQMAHFRSAGCTEDFAGIPSRYRIGDILYLKEPWQTTWNEKAQKWDLIYLYDDKGLYLDDDGIMKWKNKLFMPAKHARHFIKITGVRAERLQDVSDEDCIKEGIIPVPQKTNGAYIYNNGHEVFNRPRDAYQDLINKINGKSTWNDNPYVWVYDYELTTKPE